MRRLIDQDRKREQRRQQRLMLLLERRFSPMFRAEIQRASDIMIEEFVSSRGRAPTLPIDHVMKIEALYKQLATTCFELFGTRVFEQGKSCGLVMERKDFTEALMMFGLSYIADEMVRTKITNVSETTRQNIVEIIADGFADGLGVSEIGKNLSRSISVVNRMRGDLIARTETHGAANAGADAGARSTGLTLNKEWVASGDNRTRIAHSSADGQVVAMDSPFLVGGENLMYPGAPGGSAGNVINCRCTVAHLVDEDL